MNLDMCIFIHLYLLPDGRERNGATCVTRKMIAMLLMRKLINEMGQIIKLVGPNTKPYQMISCTRSQANNFHSSALLLDIPDMDYRGEQILFLCCDGSLLKAVSKRPQNAMDVDF